MKQKGPRISPHEPEEELAGASDAFRDAETARAIMEKKAQRKKRAQERPREQGTVDPDGDDR